jgi:hypothetical protein
MPGTLHDKVDRLEELKDYLNIFIEERTTRAATSSCHHQIIHPPHAVKFLSTLAPRGRPIGRIGHLCRNFSERWSAATSHVYEAINRPLWPPGWSTAKSSLQIVEVSDIRTFDTRIGRFRRSGLSSVDKWKESAIPRTPLLRKHWCLDNEYYDNDL